jgi:aryl-alcohol dehydrogenase-like predicted oxidoreductase
MPFLAVNPRFMGANLERNIAATSAFRNLAKDMGMAASTLAIAWLLHQDDHIIPIPGTRSVKHFAELIAAAEVRLHDEDKARIHAVCPPVGVMATGIQITNGEPLSDIVRLEMK